MREPEQSTLTFVDIHAETTLFDAAVFTIHFRCKKEFCCNNFGLPSSQQTTFQFFSHQRWGKRAVLEPVLN